MKKQSVCLLWMLLLLAVLVAAVFGLRYYQDKKAQEDADTQEQVLFDIDKDTIQEMSYDYEGQRYTFQKEGDIWYDADNRSLDLNQTSMDSMAINLSQMQIVQTIEDVEDKAQYGLAEGYRELTFLAGTESYTLYIGNYNEMLDIYYVCKPSENTVYTLSGQTVLCFSRTSENLKKTSE